VGSFALLLSLLASQISASQTTYYVDATKGSDINAGVSSTVPWKTISKVNSSSLKPGDHVLFMRGQTWREELLPPNSGSVGSPITFASYSIGALPIISGADLVSTWTDNSGNIANTWKARLTTEPHQVFFDNTRGTSVASIAACNGPGKWHWAADVLYAYATTNPTNTYASPGVEASVRDGAYNTYTRNHITIKNIEFTKGNGNTTGTVYIGTNNIALTSVIVSDGAGNGIFTTTGDSAVVITGCDLHNNLHQGVAGWHGIASSGHENYLQNSVIHDNLMHGIEFTDNYWIIQSDTVYNNGNSGEGWEGIELYSNTANGWARHNIIRYNTVYGQKGTPGDGTGIQCDNNADSNNVYYNLCYGNDGSGFADQASNFNNFYNNTAYGNCRASGPGGSEWAIIATGTDHVVLKNNIGYCTNNAHAIYVSSDACNQVGLNITNNMWYAPNSSCFYSWGGTVGNSLSTWNALTGVGTDLNSDPLFVNPTSHIFAIQSTSPAIDKGMGVGLKVDYVGYPITPSLGLPDIGAYEYQGSPPASSFPVGSLTASPDSLFTGGLGTLIWTDSNATSASIDNGVGSVSINGGKKSVTTDTSVTFILTLTNSSGSRKYKATITVMPLITEMASSRNPATFSLGQNYPNPFNPSTAMRYEVPSTSHVTLTVFDMLGREVSVLVNDRREAGVYQVKFDGSNLASGMYFYRLRAGSFVATKRLLLLR